MVLGSHELITNTNLSTDFDNKSSSSNNSAALPHNSSTIYTPSSQQKRFNPFMKESPVQVIVTPLTPTKEHPLKAMAEDSSEQSEDDSNINGIVEEDVNKNQMQIDDNHNTAAVEKNEEEPVTEESTEEDGKGVVKTLLPPGKVVKRKKNTTTNSKGSRPNSLNRNSLPPLNHSDIMSSSTDSTDKLDGGFFRILFLK